MKELNLKRIPNKLEKESNHNSGNGRGTNGGEEKMKKDLEIQTELRNKENKIVKYIAKKIVKSSGTGAVIYLPKELIGKEVKIEYKI